MQHLVYHVLLIICVSYIDAVILTSRLLLFGGGGARYSPSSDIALKYIFQYHSVVGVHCSECCLHMMLNINDALFKAQPMCTLCAQHYRHHDAGASECLQKPLLT